MSKRGGKEMERTKKEKPFMKTINRGLSYIFLLFSVFAVCYSVNSVVQYISIKKENSDLQKALSDLKQENERLGILNDKLKDSDYFSIYVKDKYQYSPNKDSVIPID